MTKRQLIDEIVQFNPTARPNFLAQFGDRDLDDYLRHLQKTRTPRLPADMNYSRYFKNLPTIPAGSRQAGRFTQVSLDDIISSTCRFSRLAPTAIPFADPDPVEQDVVESQDLPIATVAGHQIDDIVPAGAMDDGPAEQTIETIEVEDVQPAQHQDEPAFVSQAEGVKEAFLF